MARICAVTGKRPTKGRRIHRKGQAKRSGGIGTHVTKATRRTFRPNLQRVRVRQADGSIKAIWVSAKALKAGKVERAFDI